MARTLLLTCMANCVVKSVACSVDRGGEPRGGAGENGWSGDATT